MTERKRQSNGEGHVYQRPNGTWAGTVRLGYKPDGTPHRPMVYAKTEAEARRKLRRIIADHEKGIPVQTRKRTVREFLAEWQADLAATWAPKTAKTNRYQCETYLIPHLGKLTLDKLTQRDVQRMLDAMIAAGKSPRTARQAREVLRNALSEAERRDLLTRNVAKLARPPKERKREKRALSPAQVRTLFDAVRGTRWESLFVITATLGLRQGEVLGLRWQDVDLDAGRLTLRYQLQDVTPDDARASIVRLTPKWALVDLKTDYAARTLFLPAPALDALKRHRVAQLQERLLAGGRWHDLDLIHASTIGTPVDPANLRKLHYQTLQNAGLPRITFHELRHTASTVLKDLDLPAATAQSILGHSDVHTTLQVYTHTNADALKDAANRLSDLYRASGDA